MHMSNDNCLDGIRCKCGNTDRFLIAANVVAEVTDDGAEAASPQHGNGFEWNEDRHCRCPRCDKQGSLKDFRRTLPPDPEGMNDRRAEWAAKAMSTFTETTGTDLEDSLGDLLCDLMHWADRNDFDFHLALDRARWHYDVETGGDADE